MKRKATRKRIGIIQPETEYVENGGGTIPGSEYTDIRQDPDGGLNPSDPIAENTSGGTALPTLYNSGGIVPDPAPAKVINWPLLLAAGALLYFISKKK